MTTFAQPAALEERYLRSYLAMTLSSAFVGLTVNHLTLTPLNATRGHWRLSVLLSNGTAHTALVVATGAGHLESRFTVDIRWDAPV